MCRLCNLSFTLKCGGIDSIDSHSKSKNPIVSKKITQPINNFFVVKLKVIASQITIICHNIRHNLCYNSLDFNLKLIAKIFEDSVDKEELAAICVYRPLGSYAMVKWNSS